jgi:hypothetical protein
MDENPVSQGLYISAGHPYGPYSKIKGTTGVMPLCKNYFCFLTEDTAFFQAAYAFANLKAVVINFYPVIACGKVFVLFQINA